MKGLPILFIALLTFALIGCKDDGVVKEFIYLSSTTYIGQAKQDTIKTLITSGYAILDENVKNPQIRQDNGVISSFRYNFHTDKHQAVDIIFLVDQNNVNDIFYNWKFGNGIQTQIRIVRKGKNNYANYFSSK